MPTDSALRVNERNGVIFLVITFGPRVLVIKMSKMADFLYILLMKAKIKQSVWAKYLTASKRSHLILLENAIDYWVLSSHEQDVNP